MNAPTAYVGQIREEFAVTDSYGIIAEPQPPGGEHRGPAAGDGEETGDSDRDTAAR